jgi:enoyl-CoA hydratase/carnithine racemase
MVLDTINVRREEGVLFAEVNGDASIGQLFRHLSASRLVSIAQIEGRVRGVGSEFVLACDMRFAARESAIFSQFEPSFGVIPGAGGAQHLTRLMGRGRALEVMLSGSLFGGYLLYKYLPKSALFETGNTDYASMTAALGALLLIIGVIFLIRNLK